MAAGFIWLGGWRPAAAIMLAYSLMGMQIENELQSLLDGVEVPTMAALSHQQVRLKELLPQSFFSPHHCLVLLHAEIGNSCRVLQLLVSHGQQGCAEF